MEKIEKMDLTALWALAEDLKGKGEYEQAANLYEKVARSRKAGVFDGLPKIPHCKAAYALGELHEKGLIAGATMEQAARWYTRAAELGKTDAHIRLAELYLTGNGVEQSYEEVLARIYDVFFAKDLAFDGSRILYLCESILGKIDGQDGAILKIIGDCYVLGWGCEKSEQKAQEYYEKAKKIGIL